MQKIDGGYVLVSQKALLLLKAQISTRVLTTNEARGILGLLEMRSIRKAAEALRGKNKRGRALIPNYSAKELSKLTNLPFRIASKVFKAANSSDFFASEKGKLIPVPRRIIRFLAKCEKRSTILVLLTYLERGMSLDKGKIKNAGTAKASLIASQTGLTLRSVRTARAELLELGIITPDTTKYQRKLNRDGAYFTINLSWNENKKTVRVINSALSTGLLVVPSIACPVDNSKIPVHKISPPPIKNSTKISPPYRNKISSNEFRNQKTQSKASNSSGVFTKQEKKPGREGKVLLPPTIKNVQEVDLKQFSRCKTLYEQACERGLIRNSEASFLNFIAAAVRGKSSKGGDPVKIFMGIIKKGLWMNITQEQEDRARAAIKRYENH